jgi:hypothetical protein
MSFKILITSPPDREKLVAEIWYENEQVGELSNDKSDMRLEIYPCPSDIAWKFDFSEFMEALRRAEIRLVD